MPLVVPPTLPRVLTTNLSATSRTGATVTSGGTAHTKGAWASLVDPTPRAYGLWVRIVNVGVSAALHNVLVDIGLGPSGSDPDTILIPNLNGSSAGIAGDLRAKHYFFPVAIPSGARLGARCQANTASKAATVAVWLGTSPLYPWACGQVTDYGTDTTTSRGTDVTPGNGSFGSWTSIGTTSGPHQYWAVGVGNATSTTMTTGDAVLEVGIGPDSSNVSTILVGAFHTDNTELIDAVFPPCVYAPVPSSTGLWARVASNNTVAVSVILYGMR